MLRICVLTVLTETDTSPAISDLDEGDAMRPARAPGPGAQQRRLPAARRRGDNRHLSLDRAVQAGDEIVASDQPGRVHATFTRLWRKSPACGGP